MVKIVNHPTVDFVDKLGTDLTIVNAARVSFAKHKDTLDQDDIKLLNYLAKHNHWSPFAHAQVQLRITAPIFVARQLVKHQIGLVWNEESRRYVADEPTFFLPAVWRGKPVNAKQGSNGEVTLPNWLVKDIEDHLRTALRLYGALLEAGVAPEQARMVLTQNMMTSWYWTGSLYACARICSLRLDSHAQAETSEVGKQIWDKCYERFPEAWRALEKHYIQQVAFTEEQHFDS